MSNDFTTDFTHITFRTILGCEVMQNLQPTREVLRDAPIQDLMRDYAAVADWSAQFYANHGRSSNSYSAFRWATDFMDTVGSAIRLRLQL